jgi:biopolymer transport protein TolR
VVPYIDVMLVLLVIFMVTAPLLSQGVKVDLPQVRSETLPPTSGEPVIVTVDETGKLYLNLSENTARPIDAGLLTQQVSAILQRRPETPVYVKGHQAAGYGSVVLAMALLQGAGASTVGLITEPAATPPAKAR